MACLTSLSVTASARDVVQRAVCGGEVPSQHAAGAWQAPRGSIGVSHGRASRCGMSPTPARFVPKGVSVLEGVQQLCGCLELGTLPPDFGFQPPKPDPASPCLGKPSASLLPRALLRSMLQPLLTPRRDRWTRQGIACTGGTWLIPLAGLCLRPLALTLPMLWRSPSSRAASPTWCPSLWPLGTAAGLYPQGSAYFSRLLPSQPLLFSSRKELPEDTTTKTHQNLPKTVACWWHWGCRDTTACHRPSPARPHTPFHGAISSLKGNLAP